MVSIIRIIKDGEVIDESDNLHYIYERLIIYDKKVKDLEIRVAKHK
tara:strand:- start:941 stop:1078 length:138 start_codon:yes stop_codon:yes gene_type:complete